MHIAVLACLTVICVSFIVFFSWTGHCSLIARPHQYQMLMTKRKIRDILHVPVHNYASQCYHCVDGQVSYFSVL